MADKKKLIFKIGQFPQLSETFILVQIITAIK
jgi:colanic acid/amylovoran biosynthesis glycosyltransferase